MITARLDCLPGSDPVTRGVGETIVLSRRLFAIARKCFELTSYELLLEILYDLRLWHLRLAQRSTDVHSGFNEWVPPEYICPKILPCHVKFKRVGTYLKLLSILRQIYRSQAWFLEYVKT